MRGIVAVLFLSVLALSGCATGAGGGVAGSGGGAASGAPIMGTVHGGQQPISQATVTLWTVGTTGYGSTPTQLTTTTTNSSGNFTLPAPTCASPSELTYLTATGGSPGGSNPVNTDIAMMTAIGACSGASSMTVNLNEVTTVASVYAMAQFMNTANGNIGAYSASMVGLSNAMATVNNLVSVSAGTAYQYTPAANGVVPQAEIDTLANLLATCVNSTGGTAGQNNPCGNLFTATTYGSSVPTNTLLAALNIALYPGANATAQWNLVTTTGPFQPTLTSAPSDWAMAVQIAGTGAAPSDLAIDASGNIWVANYGGTNTYGGTSEVNNLGAIVLSAQYNSSAVGEASVAIDLSGNAWAGFKPNAEFMEIAPAGASTTGPFQLSETNKPEGIAVDGNNNVWITNGGSNSVTEMSNRGGSSVALSPSGGYTGGGLNLPIGIAIDTNNDAWIANLSGNVLTEISPAGSVTGGYTGTGLNQPAIVAADGNAHIWVDNNNANTVAEFSSGTEVDPGGSGISGGGISAGGGLSVDGNGNIWIADATGNALSEVNSSGTVVSPTNGYLGASPNLGTSTNCEGKTYSGGNLNYPYSTRVDSSGNVWVINYCEVKFSSSFYAGLTEFVGLGVPTIQPLAAAVQQGLIGKRPGTPTGITLAVTTSSLPSSVRTAKYSYQLLAKGGTGNGYTWTVMSGSSTLSSIGLSLSSSGLLSGTLSGTVNGASIGFKVTDSGGNTATATLSLTVSSLGTLSITTTNIASGTVGTNYSQSFAATGGSGSYTWSIPAGSQLTALNNAGLGYGPSGNVSGTPTASGSFPFTMQVTDLATGQTATAPYTLIVSAATLSQCTHDGSGNAILNGHYAFLLGGFDPNGHYYDQIGSFVANGAGTITGGVADANGDNMLTDFANGEQSYTFSGTYSIGSTDDRGIMTVSNSNTSATGLPSTSIYCFVADTVTSGVAYSGRIIEADGTGYIQTGVFAIQTTANFNAAALSGGYAFGVQGVDTPPNRRASVGQFTLNGSGGVSSGQLDFASANNSGTSESYNAAVAILNTSTYTMGANGRGTLTLNVNGITLGFITYEFGSNQLFLLTANDSTSTLLLGQATPQTLTTFTTANIKGSGVFRSDGSPGAVADDMQVGVLTYDGSGNATAVIDQNNAGTITAPSSVQTATYSVTSLGYLTTANSGSHPANFYLYAPGGGYGVSSSSQVDFWTMVPQTVPNGGFTSSSLSGAYSSGSVPNAAYSLTGAGTTSGNAYPVVQNFVITFGSGSSASYILDENQAPGTAQDVSTDQTGSTTWSLDPTYGATYGRFTVTGGGPIGYIVSPSQAMLLLPNSGKDGSLQTLNHQ